MGSKTGLPMTPLKQKLTIEQGRTFRFPIRWESEVFGYAAISAISASAPCLVTTTQPHGIPEGWRAAVVSARGMVEINALQSPPADDEFRRSTVRSTTQIEFNDLNSADFTAYVSGGYLQFRLPVDLTGYTARMSVKDKIGGTVLLSLSSTDGSITLDNTTKTITLKLTATATAAYTWKSGVYDLEVVSPTGDVFALINGAVVVVQEITTN